MTANTNSYHGNLEYKIRETSCNPIIVVSPNQCTHNDKCVIIMSTKLQKPNKYDESRE